MLADLRDATSQKVEKAQIVSMMPAVPGKAELRCRSRRLLHVGTVRKPARNPQIAQCQWSNSRLAFFNAAVYHA